MVGPRKRLVKIHLRERFAEMCLRLGIEIGSLRIKPGLDQCPRQCRLAAAWSVEDTRARWQAERWEPIQDRLLNDREPQRLHLFRLFRRTSSYTLMVFSTMRLAEKCSLTSRLPASARRRLRSSSSSSLSIAVAISPASGSTTRAVRSWSTTSPNAPRFVEMEGNA